MVEKNNSNLKTDNLIDPVKKRTEKVLKAFSVVITIFLLMVLVVIKINVPTFPIIWFIVIFGILVVVGLTVFFISNIINFIKNKNKEGVEENEKMPKSLTLGELRKICREALTNEEYANHTVRCLGEKFITLKKSRNIIYVYKTESLYRRIGEKGIVYIVINTNFPEIKSILFDPTSYELHQTINNSGNIAEDEPATEEIERENPLLGTKETIRRNIPHKDDEKEIKKEDREEIE